MHMIFGGFLFWLLLLFVILWAVRGTRGCYAGGHPYWRHYYHDHAHGEDAIEIARKRYARGEITKEEFEQLKQDLR